MKNTIVREVFTNLAAAGQLELIILTSQQTGLVPTIGIFEKVLEVHKGDWSHHHKTINCAVKSKMPLMTLTNLAKALILYGAAEGLDIAVKLKDKNLSSYVMRNIGPDEARSSTPQALIKLFKNAERSAVNTFRKMSVRYGEYKLALFVSKFEKVPLTDKEIDTIMKYNRDLPSLTDLVAGAKHFGRKLTEADIKPGIEDAFDNGGNWKEVFNAVKAVGRKLNDDEWALLLDQTERWSSRAKSR